MLFKVKISLFFILGLLAFTSFSASAFSTITNYTQQSTTVNNTCIILSTDNLNFGNYNPASPLSLQTSGLIKLNCTKGTSMTIVPVSGGTSMTGSGGSLNYELYTDSGFTSLFGMTTYNYFTVNLGPTNVKASLLTNIASFSDCATLANGTGFFYNKDTNTTTSNTHCYLNFGSGTPVTFNGQTSTVVTGNPNYGSSGSNGQIGIYSISSNGTINQLVAPTGYSASFYINGFFLPANKTTVSGTSYTFASQVNQVKNGLNGVSNSSKTPLTFTYYGQVPINQDLPSGNYIDSVVLQVSF